ncbi:MAG: STAS domain-containing protein [Terriglobales bacterium]
MSESTSGIDAAAALPPIDITVDRVSAKQTLLSVSGEIDMLTTPRLREVLSGHLAEPGTELLLELENVSFLGSAGLQLLAETQQQAKDAGVDLSLICSTRQVLRPLSLTGLDHMFTVYPNLESVPTE